jgi:hypothetical protein
MYIISEYFYIKIYMLLYNSSSFTVVKPKAKYVL